jgi:hypothetical protein
MPTAHSTHLQPSPETCVLIHNPANQDLFIFVHFYTGRLNHVLHIPAGTIHGYVIALHLVPYIVRGEYEFNHANNDANL